MIKKLLRVDIPADDVERAQDFYKQIFGWTFEKIPGILLYWTVKNPLPGLEMGMTLREGGGAGSSYTCTFEVDSIDNYIKNILLAGGTMLTGKMALPGTGWLAICSDTEGNAFGLQENDKKILTQPSTMTSPVEEKIGI